MMKGAGYQQYPSPDEKSKINKGGSITGTGKGSGMIKSSPFTASYDTTAHPGDDKMGATRGKAGATSKGGRKL